MLVGRAERALRAKKSPPKIRPVVTLGDESSER
jgi:hypothetical protein